MCIRDSPKKKVIEQYFIKKTERAYELFQKLSISDTIESKAIAGFKIPVNAIFDKNESLKTLRELIK